MSHHDAQQLVEWAIFGPLILIMLVVVFVAERGAKKRLADPKDKTALQLEELTHRTSLTGAGSFVVSITKQSGAPHSSQVVTGTARDAINAALTTFRRAGIGEVNVRTDMPDQLTFNRLFYGYGPRRQMKGQKVAAASIRRVT